MRALGPSGWKPKEPTAWHAVHSSSRPRMSHLQTARNSRMHEEVGVCELRIARIPDLAACFLQPPAIGIRISNIEIAIFPRGKP